MRVTRAFVGSVGAGLCLVAAAVTVLFVLSAVVAVRGWPGIDPENDVPRVTLAEATAATPAVDAPGGTPVAVAASTGGGAAPIVLGAPTRARGDSDAPRSGATAPQRSGAGGGTAPGAGTTPSGTGDSSAPSGSAPSGAPSSSPSPSAPAAPSAPTGPVADTIRDTGEAVGGVTDPVAPGSGQTITEVTDTVADTVAGTEETTDAVGSLLGGN